MSTDYKVKAGESLHDVVINSTGDISNIQLIMDANRLYSWTFDMSTITTVTVPDGVNYNRNVLNDVIYRPVCNLRINDFADQIIALDTVLEQVIDITPFECAINANGELIAEIFYPENYDLTFDNYGNLIIQFQLITEDFNMNNNGEIEYENTGL